MMKSLMMMVILVCAASPVVADNNLRQAAAEDEHRRLGGRDLAFDPAVDYCKIGRSDDGQNIYGDCIPEIHFPKCDDDEFYCYNRINRRDKFWPDKVPHFYIDPIRIHCYPNSWLTMGGCSTCSPGRYCLSENRCILDELGYECERWL
mmetsp:Transcript_7121/g.10407  ORF Transcript_7121/g.10407 Transcript_7121/m.10407 type:complete len:148 (-) Transcript_7121:124-567(-)